MPEFYMIFARKIFLPDFFWGGTAPLPPSPTPMHVSKVITPFINHFVAICNMQNRISRVLQYIDWPELKRTRAFRQLYSAESTWRALSFSTCSWKMRIWSMKATTRSAAIGLAWRPAAASSGATCKGIEHCAALRTNSSLQANRNNDTWSDTYIHADAETTRLCSYLSLLSLKHNLASDSQASADKTRLYSMAKKTWLSQQTPSWLAIVCIHSHGLYKAIQN